MNKQNTWAVSSQVSLCSVSICANFLGKTVYLGMHVFLSVSHKLKHKPLQQWHNFIPHWGDFTKLQSRIKRQIYLQVWSFKEYKMQVVSTAALRGFCIYFFVFLVFVPGSLIRLNSVTTESIGRPVRESRIYDNVLFAWHLSQLAFQSSLHKVQ